MLNLENGNSFLAHQVEIYQFWQNAAKELEDQYGIRMPESMLLTAPEPRVIVNTLVESTDITDRVEYLAVLHLVDGLDIKNHCTRKHVNAVSTADFSFVINGQVHDSKIAGVGVNGWNPLLVDVTKYTPQEAYDRVHEVLDHKSVVISKHSIERAIRAALGSKSNKNALSCLELDEVLAKLLTQSEFAQGSYCRMYPFGTSEGKVRSSQWCPSSDYCAEGSAQLNMTIAAEIAKLLGTPFITVLGAMPDGMRKGNMWVKFIPGPPEEMTSMTPWLLRMPRLDRAQDISTGAVMVANTPTSFLSVPYSDQRVVMQVERVGHDAITISHGILKKGEKRPSPNTFTGKTRISYTENLFAPVIKNNNWLSDYPPCGLCSREPGRRLKLLHTSDHYDIRPLSGLYFEKFSRFEERIDRQDLISLLHLFWRGVQARRIGYNLPRPQWRKNLVGNLPSPG